MSSNIILSTFEIFMPTDFGVTVTWKTDHFMGYAAVLDNTKLAKITDITRSFHIDNLFTIIQL